MHPDHCPETRRRIRLAVYAYAYEFENVSLVSDAEFDALARQVDLSVSTGNATLDQWFSENFTADTGLWIHRHPALDRIRQLYREVYCEPLIATILKHVLQLARRP